MNRGFGDNPISNAVGDGAAAVLVDVVDGRGCVVDIKEESSPQLFDFITLKLGMLTGREESISFTENKRVIYKSIAVVAKNAQSLMDRNNITADDISWTITHQPGLAAIEKWHEMLDIPLAKNLNTYRTYGNVSAANIPLSLDHYSRVEKKIKSGDLILMFSGGSGVHSVAALIEWP